MSDPNFYVEVTEEPPAEVTVVEDITLVDVAEEEANLVTVSMIGIQGAVGPTGPAGVVVQSTPPTNTSVIWVDNS